MVPHVGKRRRSVCMGRWSIALAAWVVWLPAIAVAQSDWIPDTVMSPPRPAVKEQGGRLYRYDRSPVVARSAAAPSLPSFSPAANFRPARRELTLVRERADFGPPADVPREMKTVEPVAPPAVAVDRAPPVTAMGKAPASEIPSNRSRDESSLPSFSPEASPRPAKQELTSVQEGIDPGPPADAPREVKIAEQASPQAVVEPAPPAVGVGEASIVDAPLDRPRDGSSLPMVLPHVEPRTARQELTSIPRQVDLGPPAETPREIKITEQAPPQAVAEPMPPTAGVGDASIADTPPDRSRPEGSNESVRQLAPTLLSSSPPGQANSIPSQPQAPPAIPAPAADEGNRGSVETIRQFLASERADSRPVQPKISMETVPSAPNGPTASNSPRAAEPVAVSAPIASAVADTTVSSPALIQIPVNEAAVPARTLTGMGIAQSTAEPSAQSPLIVVEAKDVVKDGVKNIDSVKRVAAPEAASASAPDLIPMPIRDEMVTARSLAGMGVAQPAVPSTPKTSPVVPKAIGAVVPADSSALTPILVEEPIASAKSLVGAASGE